MRGTLEELDTLGASRVGRVGYFGWRTGPCWMHWVRWTHEVVKCASVNI